MTFDQPRMVYLFRSDAIASGRNTVVCAAPVDLAVAAFGGGGDFDEVGIRQAFGGNAYYRNDETGATFIAVWGSRNAGRFRSALRDKARISIVREPPPARLAWLSTAHQRPPHTPRLQSLRADINV